MVDENEYVDPFDMEKGEAPDPPGVLRYLNLSAYRGNDDERWRNVRMVNVAHEMIRRDPTATVAIYQIHDHKGSLFASTLGQDKELIARALKLLGEVWEEQCELNEVYPMEDLMYRPHPYIKVPYVAYI